MFLIAVILWTCSGVAASAVVGIRPQALEIRPGESGLSVELSERLDGVSYDYLRTLIGERIVVESRGDKESPPGMQVDVEFDHSTALLFDSRSGQRIR